MTRTIWAMLVVLTLTGLTGAGPAEERAKLVAKLGSAPVVLAKSKKTPDEIANVLFLDALRRQPTESEKTRIGAHLAQAKNRQEAIRDLVWALANTKEFMKVQKIATFAELMELSKKIQDYKGPIVGEKPEEPPAR